MKTIAPGIAVDPKIRFGKPTIRGTRVAVETILAEIAGGMTVEEILREYHLTRRQIRDAIAYAQRLLEGERHVVA